jgi:hypothetical protein
MNANRLVVVLALSVFLGLGSAHADPPIVYETSAIPGAEKILVPGPQTLNITIDMGAAAGSGTPCVNGDGDQLCGADVRLTLSGDGQIDSFNAGSGVIFEPPSSSVLRLNIMKTDSAPLYLLGPQNLGALYITVLGTASETNQVKVEASGQVVNAAGDLMSISSKIAVPEPSGLVLLLSGTLGLSALHGLRTRGATATASGGSQSPK